MSLAWDFFVLSADDESIAICNRCKAQIRRGSIAKGVRNYSTTPLLNHAKGMHPQAYNQAKAALSKAKADSAKADSSVKSPTASASLSASFLSSKKKTPTPGERKKEAQQLSILEHYRSDQFVRWRSDDARAKKANLKLVQMIVMDNQPFTICEDEGFIRYSAHLEPQYTIPSRKTITYLVDSEYERVLRCLENEASGHSWN